MKYYLKTLIIPYIYLIFVAVSNLGFIGSEKIPSPLILALLLLMLAVYIFILAAFSYKHGEQAYKDLLSNDRERKVIIETGQDRPLKLHEEYRAWKGFFMGLLVCAPLIIFMLLHSVLMISGSTYSGFGYLAGLLYSVVFSILEWIKPVITAGDYFFSLLAIPVICLATGIPYIFGGLKVKKVKENIDKQKEFLHGKQN